MGVGTPTTRDRTIERPVSAGNARLAPSLPIAGPPLAAAIDSALAIALWDGGGGGRKGNPPQTYTSAFRPQSLRSPLPQAKCPSTVGGRGHFGFLSTKTAPIATFTPAFRINNSTAIVPHERRFARPERMLGG